MKFLKKIRQLSLTKRKIILWTIVIILGLFLFIVWIVMVSQRLRTIQTESFFKEIEPPAFDFPAIEMPTFPTTTPTLPEI
jgi:uncharacterized membrane protein YvbJ